MQAALKAGVCHGWRDGGLHGGVHDDVRFHAHRPHAPPHENDDENSNELDDDHPHYLNRSPHVRSGFDATVRGGDGGCWAHRREL